MKNNLLPQHCTFFPLLFTLPIALSACANTLPLPHPNECKIPSLYGNVSLNSSCVYHQQLVITASHTTLNCQGATLEGSNQLAFGIVVNSKGKPLSDVTIQNCKIHNFTHSGIRITSDIAANKLSADHQENYRRTPTNVKIDNVEVTGSGRVGVYFDSYVTNSSLRNSLIEHSGGVGIYLEHSSKKNKLINNRVFSNGNTSNNPKREGIAVDSSAENLIEGNSLYNNGLGGIFLYKNCGEKYSSGKSVIRWQHSDHNKIIRNEFSNEMIGLWVASRSNYDLSHWDCGDKPMDKEGKYYQDFANNNLIKENTFCKNTISMIVNGYGNISKKNINDCKILKKN